MVFFLLSRNCYGKGTKDWDGLDDYPFPFLYHIYYCQSYQGIFFGPATITTHQKWQRFVIFHNLFSKHDMSNSKKRAKPLSLSLSTYHFCAIWQVDYSWKSSLADLIFPVRWNIFTPGNDIGTTRDGHDHWCSDKSLFRPRFFTLSAIIVKSQLVQAVL